MLTHNITALTYFYPIFESIILKQTIGYKYIQWTLTTAMPLYDNDIMMYVITGMWCCVHAK